MMKDLNFVRAGYRLNKRGCCNLLSGSIRPSVQDFMVQRSPVLLLVRPPETTTPFRMLQLLKLLVAMLVTIYSGISLRV